MRKLIQLECAKCGKSFERAVAEHKRNQKVGRKPYCGRHCYGLANAINLPESTAESAAHLDSSNKLDEFSPFRWHFRNIVRRSKEFDLKLADLKDQWEFQKGVCPYTGWELKNMRTMSYTDQLPLTPDRASLDRIDSTKGYVKGNIQFVAVMAQYAKHGFTEQELLGFCKRVVEHGSGIERRPAGDCVAA